MASNIPDLFGDEVPAEDHKEDVQDLGAGVCPRCESVALSTPLPLNAWSRTSRGEGDTPVYVCSPCGEDEANEDLDLPGGATPQSDWPVARRNDPEPVSPDPGTDELSRLVAAIEDLRNSGSGIWQMMGGRAREPKRSDPFKLEGEWVGLDEKLWTVGPDEFAWWASHAHPAVRRIVAAHETCPPELLDTLAGDLWVEVRQEALANSALDVSTRRRVADTDPVDWLREAANHPEPWVIGRCARCGGKVRRPDRFLTCSIACSVEQARQRVDEGLYLRRSFFGWPDEYVWEVAWHQGSGGIPGAGPKFHTVILSFVPGVKPDQVAMAVKALSEREGLNLFEAVEAIDQMAQDMDGEDVIAMCCLDTNPGQDPPPHPGTRSSVESVHGT